MLICLAFKALCEKKKQKASNFTKKNKGVVISFNSFTVVLFIYCLNIGMLYSSARKYFGLRRKNISLEEYIKIAQLKLKTFDPYGNICNEFEEWNRDVL